jgi:uncharacterized protein YecT (DUF1311 family)
MYWLRTLVFDGIVVLSVAAPWANGQAKSTSAGQGNDNSHTADPRSRNHTPDYFAQLQSFKEQARTALAKELARQKAGQCPDATTTLSINVCLKKDVEVTNSNYKAYLGAVRSMLAVRPPGEDQPANGPTGRPLTTIERVSEFDRVEVAWQAYHQVQCSAAYDVYKGGTVAPSVALSCDLRLMRSHMNDLSTIYDTASH